MCIYFESIQVYVSAVSTNCFKTSNPQLKYAGTMNALVPNVSLMPSTQQSLDTNSHKQDQQQPFLNIGTWTSYNQNIMTTSFIFNIMTMSIQFGHRTSCPKIDWPLCLHYGQLSDWSRGNEWQIPKWWSVPKPIHIPQSAMKDKRSHPMFLPRELSVGRDKCTVCSVAHTQTITVSKQTQWLEREDTRVVVLLILTKLGKGHQILDRLLRKVPQT